MTLEQFIESVGEAAGRTLVEEKLSSPAAPEGRGRRKVGVGGVETPAHGGTSGTSNGPARSPRERGGQESPAVVLHAPRRFPAAPPPAVRPEAAPGRRFKKVVLPEKPSRVAAHRGLLADTLDTNRILADRDARRSAELNERIRRENAGEITAECVDCPTVVEVANTTALPRCPECRRKRGWA